jgi:hypothetical protein
VRNLLVGLFWLWVATSLAIYGYRVYRRITRGPKGDRDASNQPSQVAQSRRVTTPPPTVFPPADTIVAPDLPVTPRPSDTARSGLFASAAQSDDAAAPTRLSRSEARPTVAELVQGIAMPCGLSPVVTTDRPMDPYRVAFSTDTTTAETVGAAVGDELERLGFALTSTATNRLMATKDGEQLTVTLHTDAASLTTGDSSTYPTIPAGSVLVEFQS